MEYGRKHVENAINSISHMMISSIMKRDCFAATTAAASKCTSAGAIFRLISISKSKHKQFNIRYLWDCEFSTLCIICVRTESQRVRALFRNPHFSIELISWNMEHIVRQDLNSNVLLLMPVAYQCVYSYSYSISYFHRPRAPIFIEIAFLCACSSKIELNPFWLSYSQLQ